MSESIQDVRSKNSVNPELTNEEVEQLQRVKLVEETKQELVAWAKRQVWLLFIVISVLGAFGVTLIIKSMVGEQVGNEVDREVGRVEEALGPIQLAALSARIEADKAKQALSDMEEQRHRVQEVLSSQEKAADQLKSTFADLEADINNLRQGLKVQSESLQDQVKQIVKVLENSAKTSVDLSPQQRVVSDFEANSEYTVLVFYTPSQKVTANAIKQALLSKGYRSSSTVTDFSELGKRHPSGTIYVSHTERGNEVLGSINEIVAKLDLSPSLKIQKENSRLRRGDAQVLIF